MNLEKRLQSAAQELNQSALRTSPPPLRPAGELMRPWLAFAAALAVVLAVFGIPYALTNFGQGASPDSSPLAGAGGSTSTTECLAPETTTTPIDTWPSDIHVIAFLNDENLEGVSAGAHQALLTEVESWDEVASVSYFDKNDAWIEYQNIFEGQDDLLDIDPAILPVTIRIELTDIAFQNEVRSRLEQRTPVVREVNTAPTIEETGALEEPSVVATECIAETTVTTLPPTTTVVETTTTPDRVCHAAEFYPPTTAGYSDDGSDPRDLTEPVADKVTRIAEAAAACDASALALLASEDITTTFGPGSGPEDIASWPPDDDRFEIIAELLNMNREVTEMPDGSRLFVWPAAFAYDTWEEIPTAAMDELLRIYTEEELDQISLLGSYGGWRIGITESGEWIFFVAGD
jgi:hypothetical protein